MNLSNQGRRKMHGFTLIELMIVVAVIAIITAIAVPSYQRQVMRSKRSDALVALQQVAAAQERFYAINSRYSTNADPFAATDDIDSPEALYTVAVDINAAGTTYTATASPADGGSQEADTHCASFTLTNTGVKGSTGTYNDDGEGAMCWR